jgi:uncharacterized protein (DUF1015 family)
VIQAIDASVVASDWASSVIPPPYDSMSAAERHEHLSQNPHSFLHVTRSADASHGHPTEHQHLANQGSAALNQLISQQAYTSPSKPHLFVQKIETTEGTTQRSIIGAIDLRHETLYAHEDVHPGRVRAIAAHLRKVRSMSSPVVVTSRDENLDLRVFEEPGQPNPIRDFTAIDGTRITLWETDPSIELPTSSLYIIDGHHRVAAAIQARLTRVLVAYVPHSELHLGSFDRDIDELSTLPRWVLDKVSQWCDVREVDSRDLAEPTQRGELGLRLGDQWFVAQRRDPTGLDAEFLHTTLLPEVFDIHASDDQRLSYRPAGVDRRVGPVTLCLPPTELNEIFRSADFGQVMPPKSTYFLPKARSGVLMISC